MNAHPLEIELRVAAERHPKRLLREAWGDFVAQWPWEWFVTLTFSEDTHPERAVKLFAVWCSKLSRAIYGRRWSKREPFGVSWVVAVEFQKSGRVHLHALLLGAGDARRLCWMDVWLGLDRIAGYARIEPVDRPEAVSRYITKYVVKDGEVMFSRNLRIKGRDLFCSPNSPESEA